MGGGQSPFFGQSRHLHMGSTIISHLNTLLASDIEIGIQCPCRDSKGYGCFRSLSIRQALLHARIGCQSPPLGALTFATAESERRYADVDLALAKDLADRAAVAIENTQLYQELRENDRRKDELLATLGYEVARRLRQHPELMDLVLVALTGWGQPEDRRRTAEAGFNHHLVKPPEPKALESLLGDLKQTNG